jgi:plasmid maintenance system antidote protein VapI
MVVHENWVCFVKPCAQFWLDLQRQYDIAVIEREHGAEIARRVRPADAASGVVALKQRHLASRDGLPLLT